MKSRILKFKNPKEVVVDTNKSEEKYVLVEVNVRDRDVKLPIFLSVGEGARIVCVVIVSITGTGSVLLNSKQIHTHRRGILIFYARQW